MSYINSGVDTVLNSIHIELTSICNLHCKMCLASKNNDYLTYDDYCKVIHQLHNIKVKGHNIKNIELGGHGEPLLYEQLIDAVMEAKKHFKRVSIVTNATMLEPYIAQRLLESNIDHIELSVTGINDEIYGQFQGYNKNTNLKSKVISNINNLIYLKKKLQKKVIISLSYIKTTENTYHLKQYIKYWRKQGADRIYIHPLVNENEHYIRKSKHKSCYLVGNSLFIHSNGDVKICCYDFKRNIIIGNILKDNIDTIINSKKYLNIISCNNNMDFANMPEECKRCSVLKRNSICNNITNRRRVIYLNGFLNRIKGVLISICIFIYQIAPSSKIVYKILFWIKEKLNIV